MAGERRAIEDLPPPRPYRTTQISLRGWRYFSWQLIEKHKGDPKGSSERKKAAHKVREWRTEDAQLGYYGDS